MTDSDHHAQTGLTPRKENSMKTHLAKLAKLLIYVPALVLSSGFIAVLWPVLQIAFHQHSSVLVTVLNFTMVIMLLIFIPAVFISCTRMFWKMYND